MLTGRTEEEDDDDENWVEEEDQGDDEEDHDKQAYFCKMAKTPGDEKASPCDESPSVLPPPPVTMTGSYQDYLANGMWESSGAAGSVVMEACQRAIPGRVQLPAQVPPIIQPQPQQQQQQVLPQQQQLLQTAVPETIALPPSTEPERLAPQNTVVAREPEQPKKKHSGTENTRSKTSSYEFRQKQKMYIQNLEQRVGELTAANAELQSRMHLLVNENSIIKEHLCYLRNFVSQAVTDLPLPSAQITVAAPDLSANQVFCQPAQTQQQEQEQVSSFRGLPSLPQQPQPQQQQRNVLPSYATLKDPASGLRRYTPNDGNMPGAVMMAPPICSQAQPASTTATAAATTSTTTASSTGESVPPPLVSL